jgi:hypothetical protein
VFLPLYLNRSVTTSHKRKIYTNLKQSFYDEHYT